jgi:hypothetical protein
MGFLEQNSPKAHTLPQPRGLTALDGRTLGLGAVNRVEVKHYH